MLRAPLLLHAIKCVCVRVHVLTELRRCTKLWTSSQGAAPTLSACSAYSFRPATPTYWEAAVTTECTSTTWSERYCRIELLTLHAALTAQRSGHACAQNMRALCTEHKQVCVITQQAPDAY